MLLAKAPVADLEQLARAGRRRRGGRRRATRPTLHAEDTLRAGRGLCRASAVERADRGGARADRRPRRRSASSSTTSLGLEGGHSRRRVVHAGGAETGAAISARARRARVREHPRIARRTRASASSSSGGRRPLRRRGHRARGALARRATLLATGGYAALWERTTNPPGALGEGLALAYRAGAALADLEFVQFHPTALVDDGFLLSRGAARRGRAARSTSDGERFTDELAPRDVVARAIAERGTAPARPARDRARALPGLMATLERAGYDPADEPIPVSPAAHYTMGGIVTDLDGRTDVPGLYAAGECACTGRPRREPARVELAARVPRLRPPRRARRARRAGAPRTVLARQPTRPRPTPVDAGAARTRSGATPASSATPPGSSGSLARPHLLARLVAESALARAESRGGHFRADFPHRGRGVRRATSSSAAGRRARGAASDGADRRARARRRGRARRGRRRGRRARPTAVVAADARCDAPSSCSRSPASSAGSAPPRPSSRRSTPSVRFEPLVADGDRVEPAADRRASRARPARCSRASALALNLLGRLSRHRDADRAATSTRSTAPARRSSTRARRRPGLRALEKYAVALRRRHEPPRSASTTRVLSRRTTCALAGGDRAPRSRRRARDRRCRSRSRPRRSTRCGEALAAGVDRILLDNMSPAELARRRSRSSPAASPLEASGGVTLETVRAYRRDGRRLHLDRRADPLGARSLDVSLEVL